MNIKTTLIVLFCLANLGITTMLFLEIQEVKAYLNDKSIVLNKEFITAVPVYKLPSIF